MTPEQFSRSIFIIQKDKLLNDALNGAWFDVSAITSLIKLSKTDADESRIYSLVNETGINKSHCVNFDLMSGVQIAYINEVCQKIVELVYESYETKPNFFQRLIKG